jgi:hypothetical protein
LRAVRITVLSTLTLLAGCARVLGADFEGAHVETGNGSGATEAGVGGTAGGSTDSGVQDIDHGGSPGDSGADSVAVCECTPRATETNMQACGNCGHRLRARTCNDGCTWGAWTSSSSCEGHVAVSQVTTHDAGGCALLTGGSLWCWGKNGAGQLGLGDDLPRLTPTKVEGATWAEIVGGTLHVCGRQSSGGLFCWGSNAAGQLGVGVSDTTDRHSPTRVGSESDWVQIALGDFHTCALRGNGTLWCWGANWDGRLGLGDWTQRETPQQVPGTDWIQVALGIHTCARKRNNTLWCWGYNSNGQLGNGDDVSTPNPTQVAGNWLDVASGQIHTCGRKEDNSLWCWGSNQWGQLGLGDNADRFTPQRVTTATNWSEIAVGESSSCARQAGRLYCWGANSKGSLGIGDYATRNAPVEVAAAAAWTQIAPDWMHSCALQSDETLWCWGDYERVGLGVLTAHQPFPRQLGCFGP